MAHLGFDRLALELFCRRNHIRRLALFGSAIDGHVGPASDIDLLVEFDVGHVPGLLRVAEMELELAALLGVAEVDLRTYEDLSRYFRDEVLATARALYDAA